MKKRNKILSLILIVAVVVAACVMLTACKPDKNPVTEKTDVLVIGSTMTINSLNRLDADGGQKPGYYFDVLSGTISQMTPVYTDAAGEFHTAICNYTISEDGLVYTFTVKDGYTWHDGTAVNADDIVYSVNKQYKVGEGKDFVSVTKTNDKTAVVTLPAPNPRVLSKFALLRLMPFHLFDGKTAETLTDAESVIGCGPFKFSKFDKDAGVLEFEKYGAYPGASKITFNKIIFKFFGEDDVMNLALEKGDIDMEYVYAKGITPGAEAFFKDKSNVKLDKYADKSSPMNLFFNNAKVTDVKVKKAVQKAIDYTKLRRLFGSSAAVPSRAGFITGAVLGYSETPELVRDLEGAKTLLTQAGYGTANKFDFEITVRSDGAYSEVAKALKTDLEETGMITVSVKSYEKTLFATKIQAGEHQACLGAVTAGGMDMQGGLATKYMLPNQSSALSNNPVSFANIAVETGELAERTAFGNIYYALTDASNLEEYKTAAAAYQNYIVENVPAIALYNDNVIQAYSTKLSGFAVDGIYGLLNIRTYETLRKS